MVSAAAVSTHYLFALGRSVWLWEEYEGLLTLGQEHATNVWWLRSRTLFVGKIGLEQAKQAIISYKTGQTKEMTPQLWQAKKIVDSTLHPGMA